MAVIEMARPLDPWVERLHADMPPTSSRRQALTIKTIGLVFLVLGLSGCIRSHDELVINPDGTVDGEITIAVSEDFLAGIDMSFDELMAELDEAPLLEAADGAVAPYEESGFVGRTYSLDDVPLEEVNAIYDGDLVITREGDSFVVSGRHGVDTLPEGIDPTDPAVLAALREWDVDLSVTFPGDVSEHDGVLEGRTVSWSPRFDESFTISAAGSVGSSSFSIVWLVVTGAFIVVAIAVVLLVVRRARTRSRVEPRPDDARDDGPGARVS